MSYRHFPGRVKIIPSLPSREVSYWYTCTKSGKLILRKIINIVATRRHILQLICRKRSPDPIAGYKGLISKGTEGRKDGREEERGMNERKREEKGEEKRGKNHTGTFPPLRVLMMVNLVSDQLKRYQN